MMDYLILIILILLLLQHSYWSVAVASAVSGEENMIGKRVTTAESPSERDHLSRRPLVL
jgi:hypothetical protein